jgi:uncharacterized protein YPO0396
MTTHTDLIARLREFGPCIAQDVQDALESLEQQVAALTKERDELEISNAFAHGEWRAVKDQLAALTKERDELLGPNPVEQMIRDQLAAAQAREAKLRDAAKAVLEVGMGSDFEALNAALALPTDDSALIERLKKEREKVITWIDNNYQDLANLDELFEAIRSMT